MAQLQKNSTTTKTNAQLQKQMHNCKTHLLQLYYYLFPCSYVTQQRPSATPPAERAKENEALLSGSGMTFAG
jgi:hypothetical protein